MNPDRSFAVAYAARPGFHSLDGLHLLGGPSGWVTQDNRSIYFVVVAFLQGEFEASPSPMQADPAYIH